MKHMVQFLAGHKTHGLWVHGILELIFCILEVWQFLFLASHETDDSKERT